MAQILGNLGTAVDLSTVTLTLPEDAPYESTTSVTQQAALQLIEAARSYNPNDPDDPRKIVQYQVLFATEPDAPGSRIIWHVHSVVSASAPGYQNYFELRYDDFNRALGPADDPAWYQGSPDLSGPVSGLQTGTYLVIIDPVPPQPNEITVERTYPQTDAVSWTYDWGDGSEPLHSPESEVARAVAAGTYTATAHGESDGDTYDYSGLYTVAGGSTPQTSYGQLTGAGSGVQVRFSRPAV